MGVVYKFRTLAIFGQLTKSKVYKIFLHEYVCLIYLTYVSCVTLYAKIDLKQTRAYGSNDH